MAARRTGACARAAAPAAATGGSGPVSFGTSLRERLNKMALTASDAMPRTHEQLQKAIANTETWLDGLDQRRARLTELDAADLRAIADALQHVPTEPSRVPQAHPVADAGLVQTGGAGSYWMACRTCRARSAPASRATRCRAMSMPAETPALVMRSPSST